MSKLNEKNFGMEGYFLGDIYKKGYDVRQYRENNLRENLIQNQLFLVAFDGVKIGENCSISFPRNPLRVPDVNGNLEPYCINSALSARNEKGDTIYFRQCGYHTTLQFIDEESINKIFKPTYGDITDAAQQLLACKSILTLASRIIGKKLYNPMIIENEKAVKQYIKLFQEGPETIKRLFAYTDYNEYDFPGVNQEFCSHIEEETYKLEQTLKK